MFVTAGPRERHEQQRRIVGQCLIQLRKCGQAFFRELPRYPAAHGGNPGTPGHSAALRAQCSLHIRDTERGFEAGIVAGAFAQQDDVVVIVDQSRHDRAAVHVDHLQARVALTH